VSNTVIISIRTSQNNNAPTSLSNGELAYSFSSDKLFIGQTTNAEDQVSVEYIGGKLIVDKVANLESIIAGGGSATFTGLTLSDISKNRVLITKTGGVVEGITGTSGKVMQIAANGTPVFDDISGGIY
jgi:hypothetical protein